MNHRWWGGHLTGDGCAPQLCHADGVQRTPGGHMAHVQPGLVVLAQPAVAHRLDILGQTVVPRADLHILSVAHDRDVLLGADGKSPCHGGVVLHAVAVLSNELHAGGQGLEVVDAHAIKVLGDGDGLVCIAQPHLGSFLLHHHGLCGRGADGLGVGHQVYKGVAAGGAARLPVSMSSLYSKPGVRQWQCRSTNAGSTVSPPASTTVSFSAARAERSCPTAAILPSFT